ncbi:hypothetical protein AMATHDRAFT_6834 [Amanita thiersii Skay4041]|uniref:Uncharacterized protein n=1 Tax=Amanita thiersii Skay4041 TaxID=703135 RepID=A0A2A9NGF5_9AGAR|nr:hypothetical protein AMATHDRAFT_6834 [Amanita thiersii Skay4041]
MAPIPTTHTQLPHGHHHSSHPQHPLPCHPYSNQHYVVPPNLGLQEAQSQVLSFLFTIPDTSEALPPQHQNNGDTHPQAPNLNSDHGNATSGDVRED